MALIEVLPNVFYDDEKPWWEQNPELISFAETVMQDDPIQSEKETQEPNTRTLWAIWETTTEEGVFDMRVDYSYLYPIESSAYLTPLKQSAITVTKQ